jgi:rRNA-processing protein FCF1
VSPRDPLAGVQLVLVDGNNLLHRESGGPGAGPVRSLLARLQSAIPEPIHTTVVLDGHPAPGSRAVQKVSPRLDLRHAGSRSADDLIVQLAVAHSPVARAGVVVVSDDRALRDRVRTAGCQSQRLDWLQGLMSTRRPSPDKAPMAAADQAPTEDDEREGWRPGRGATRKKGNPRRAPRRRPS